MLTRDPLPDSTFWVSPGWETATLALANRNLRSGDCDTAVRLAQDAQAANPNFVLSYVVAANAAIGGGDLAKAEEQIRAALARNPIQFQALQAELELRLREGNTEAVRRLALLAAEHPREAGLRFLLGLAYFNSRRSISPWRRTT